MLFGSITRMTHALIGQMMEKVIDAGHDMVFVDCTMGNGNDTLFMSKLIGDRGKVVAFDIQETAIESTRRLLADNKVDNAALIKDGHQNIDSYISEADLVMFNLGYLPKGDHALITKPDTTLTAIKKSVEMLNKGGLISIISYYGHDGGKAEKDAVDTYVSSLDSKVFEVIQINKVNRPNNPPIVTFIKKT